MLGGWGEGEGGGWGQDGSCFLRGPRSIEVSTINMPG